MRWHHWLIVALAVFVGLVFLFWAGKPAGAYTSPPGQFVIPGLI